jgi:hypothetical protein
MLGPGGSRAIKKLSLAPQADSRTASSWTNAHDSRWRRHEAPGRLRKPRDAKEMARCVANAF